MKRARILASVDRWGTTAHKGTQITRLACLPRGHQGSRGEETRTWTKYGLKITKENAKQFPVTSYEHEPMEKLGYPEFLIELSRIIHRAGVQGESYGEASGTRYKKNPHTGFRGFCMSQWRGNAWLAHYFAGHAITKDAYNYVDYITVGPREKTVDYLRYHGTPFGDTDIVEEACTRLSNLGSQVGSKIRELL